MVSQSYSTSSRVSTEIGNLSRVYRLGVQPNHPGQLSLVMSRQNEYYDGYGYTTSEENGEFCVTVGPVTLQDCWHTDLVG